MHRVPGQYVAGALIPAAIIALLFFFDHSVSSQLAQQEEFNLRKSSAYHYDFMLLGFMTLLCGLIGALGGHAAKSLQLLRGIIVAAGLCLG